MTAMLLLPAVCFAIRVLRLFVAESLHRNIGKLKDAEGRRLTVLDGIRNVVKYNRSILRCN